ncbi:hypothetical protein [Micropruina sp.]|uniref:hypothetical protein n=1 Tax=Micropruina sp. TaxID=2737536 RepID=UPI0039E5D24C
MLVRPSLAIVLATITAVTVSACSAASNTPPAETPAPSTASATPVSLPVAEVFDAPAWGIRFSEAAAHKRPLVTAQRLIMLDGQQVRALDAQGKDAWATPWEGFTDEARSKGSDGYPLLRQVSPDVVAVVDGGTAQGDGLNKDTGQVKVTLMKVQDGSLIKQVTIPGTPSQIPQIGSLGLGFALPQGGVSAITPDGDVVDAPTVRSMKTTSGISVGRTGMSVWESGGSDAASGFSGPGWDSRTSGPGPRFTSASVLASDADRLLVGRWVVPSVSTKEVQIQVLEAPTGKVLSKPSCEPRTAAPLVSSPARSWQVLGPMRLDSAGKATCFGGGSGQKTVTLTAVTDAGRAFGMASADGSQALFLDLAPNGDITTLAMPEGAELPIGVMDGDIAIHWDSNEAIVTGNKIH